MCDRRVIRQCEKNNSALRRVTVRSKYSVNQLLRSNGDLLITGGQRTQREGLLLRAVSQFREQFPERTAIVFTGSADTERGLIDLVCSGGPGPLAVSSPDHRNYDVFCGLRPAEAAACLIQIAQVTNQCACGKLSAYALPFLNVLDRMNDGDIALKAMRAFALNTDSAVATYAQKNGMEPEARQIMQSPGGGREFRSLLESVSFAFEALLPDGEQETGFSLTAAVGIPCVICVRADTANPSVVSTYFAWILQALAGRQGNFALFLDESCLIRQTSFMETVEALKGTVLTVVCVENAASLGTETFLSRFSRDIILLGGTVAGMQKVLDSLGNYTHFQPANTISTPRFFWLPGHSVSSNILTYDRPKVLLEETMGFQAVIRGDCGPDISLVRRLEGVL